MGLAMSGLPLVSGRPELPSARLPVPGADVWSGMRERLETGPKASFAAGPGYEGFWLISDLQLDPVTQLVEVEMVGACL
jgi:hypothetical protein